MDARYPTLKNRQRDELIAPLVFYGNSIPRQQIHRPVKATEVAPTISHILRIRSPNASKDIPLQEFLN